MKKYYTLIIFLIFLFIILNTIDVFSQRLTAKKILPDSIISLKVGIYMDKDEFLNNSPSIPYNFEVLNDSRDYIVHPEEKNKFFVSYYDIVGNKIILSLKDIYGYYDGKGVFISYKGKPYQIIYLGSISILRYEHYHEKNPISQAVSISILGVTTTSVDKLQDVYYDIRSNKMLPKKEKNFKHLISSDITFYNEYKYDRETSKYSKTLIYLQKYNKKYPLQIDKEGIRLQ